MFKTVFEEFETFTQLNFQATVLLFHFYKSLLINMEFPSDFLL